MIGIFDFEVLREVAVHNRKQRTMPLTREEFLRRFLQHLLPKGFPRIRNFGWLANRRRKKLLPLCRDLLPHLAQQTSAEPEPALWLCPRCHGPMAVLERLTASQLLDTERRHARIFDSSPKQYLRPSLISNTHASLSSRAQKTRIQNT